MNLARWGLNINRNTSPTPTNSPTHARVGMRVVVDELAVAARRRRVHRCCSTRRRRSASRSTNSTAVLPIVPLTVIIRGRHVLIGPSLIGGLVGGGRFAAAPTFAGAFSSVRSFNTGLGIRSSSGPLQRNIVEPIVTHIASPLLRFGGRSPEPDDSSVNQIDEQAVCGTLLSAAERARPVAALDRLGIVSTTRRPRGGHFTPMSPGVSRGDLTGAVPFERSNRAEQGPSPLEPRGSHRGQRSRRARRRRPGSAVSDRYRSIHAADEGRRSQACESDRSRGKRRSKRSTPAGRSSPRLASANCAAWPARARRPSASSCSRTCGSWCRSPRSTRRPVCRCST